MRISDYWRSLNKAGLRRIIIAGAAILLVGILFFFIYFRVEHVEVQEGSHYSKEEIRELALKGPLSLNSVLAPLLYSRPVEDMAFVEAIEVDQVNRNTILVSVKEKQPVGCIKYLDCYMYFDREGKIIESAVELDRKVPYFDGLEVDSVIIGEELPVKETVLNTAVSLARIFQKNDTIPDHITFDTKFSITLQYEDIQAQLGKDVYLEEKMARLLAILPKLTGKKGILHLESVTASANKNITFEEKEEQEDSSEDESASAENTSTQQQTNEEESSQYDANGNYIGESDSTESQYDAYGNYIG
ncbi:MAG: cell division septal protein, partial [Eubacteriales bacterium]|nr:cell division septal protein [Eubacteriales bacterium]